MPAGRDTDDDGGCSSVISSWWVLDLAALLQIPFQGYDLCMYCTYVRRIGF